MSCRPNITEAGEIVSIQTCDTINVKYNPRDSITTCTLRCVDEFGNETIIYINCGALGKTSADIIIYVTRDDEVFTGVTVLVWYRREVIHNERADINGRVYVYSLLEGLIIIEGAIGPYHGETRFYKNLNENVFAELRMERH